MCQRYHIDSGGMPWALRKMLAEVERQQRERGSGVRPSGQFAEGLTVRRGDVCPSDCAAVLTAERLLAMCWGIPRFDSLGTVICAHSETIESRPFFRAARRCSVPAAHYYAWEDSGFSRTTYRIGMKGRPLLIAGLYHTIAGVPAFCILTRPPAPRIASISSRMPVILPENARDAWLAGASANAVFAAAELGVSFEEVPVRFELAHSVASAFWARNR